MGRDSPPSGLTPALHGGRVPFSVPRSSESSCRTLCTDGAWPLRQGLLLRGSPKRCSGTPRSRSCSCRHSCCFPVRPLLILTVPPGQPLSPLLGLAGGWDPMPASAQGSRLASLTLGDTSIPSLWPPAGCPRRPKPCQTHGTSTQAGKGSVSQTSHPWSPCSSWPTALGPAARAKRKKRERTSVF